jgi:EAL domain-containing protein (putative c-di-GMP-specific phosphodiesterase class I)/GGDEF domain-containing protein
MHGTDLPNASRTSFKPEIWRSVSDLLGIGEQDIVPDESRRKNTLIFTLIGSLALLAFGIANYFGTNSARLNLLGLVQMLEVLVLLVPAIVLTYRGTRPVWSEVMLILAGFVIFASNVIFGGRSGDSPYWTFVYPYLVFFLRGQKVGWLVGLSFAIVVPSLMRYSATHWDLWHYDPVHCLYYGISYFFNVLTAAYFNLLRSVFQKKLWKQVEFNTGEVRRHLETLQFNSTHDQPTGLLNRQGLIDALELTLQKPDQNGRSLQVVCITFLRVPELASIVGMDRVDASMGLLAQRLNQHLPNMLHLARPAHDKLAVVLRCDAGRVQNVTPLQGIRQIEGGSDLGEFSIHVEYTFGVVVHRDGELATATDLMRRAEQAMLFASDNGLQFQFYDAALSEHFVDRNSRYEKLREAIHNDALDLHYQPQLDLRTGKVVGAEALARWIDPQEGLILPGRFIPIIESTGLLQRFSVWTVEIAVRDCAAWQAKLPGVSVSINLSAEALLDADVAQALQVALDRWKLHPALVVIELTESVLLKSPEDALVKIRELVALGARLSIDDYGAGFSSLTYLKQLPAHEMKIDMSFVRQLAHSSQDQAIVESSIELGHDLELMVLAEGIEDAQALELLKKAGCDQGQGWYFSRALPLDEFMTWSYARNHTTATVEGAPLDLFQ